MLPKFLKVFPHEYKRVLGIPRKGVPQAFTPAPPAAAARQVAHG